MVWLMDSLGWRKDQDTKAAGLWLEEPLLQWLQQIFDQGDQYSEL